MKHLLWLVVALAYTASFARQDNDIYTGRPLMDFISSGHGANRIIVVGDSRVRNTASDFWNSNFGYTGWGERLSDVSSLRDYQVINCGIAGASMRSYINRGYWDQLLKSVRSGDIVVLYFAGNDTRPIEDTKRSCGELPGLGFRTTTIFNPYLKRDETVLTFGAYYNKAIQDIKRLGGRPYLCTCFPGNTWQNGAHATGTSEMINAWIHRIAKENEIKIIDLYTLMEKEFSSRGERESRDLFVSDKFHLSKTGALLVARLVGDTIATNSFTEPKEFKPNNTTLTEPTADAAHSEGAQRQP